MAYSPYVDFLVALCVGPGSRKYYVPKHLFLQNSGQIASSLSPLSPHIYLPDIGEGTGHVLTHYLHTGAYQTLESLETSSPKVYAEFKQALAAYHMARTYDIVGLQQLAIAEMEQCGSAITISNILEAAKEDFSKLASNVGWFQEYVTERLSAAFDDDFTIFATNNFFARISNVDLYKFVTDLRVEEKGEEQKRKQEEEQDAAVAATTTSGDPSCADQTNNASPHDNWGSPTAALLKKKKKSKKGKAAETPPAVPDPPTTFDSHNPDDSTNGAPKAAMNFGDVVSGNDFRLGGLTSGWGLGWGSDTIESAVPEVEEKPADDDGWNFSFNSKGKKAVHATPIEESVPEPVPELAKEDDAWQWGTMTSSEKKNKCENSIEEVAEEPVVEDPPPPEPAPPPVDDDWGSFAPTGGKKKTKKGKRYPKQEPPPPPAASEPEPEPVYQEPLLLPTEPEPESEPVKEEPLVNPFKGLGKSDKKKLEAKMRKEAEAKVEEEKRFKEEEKAAVAAVATESPENDGWSYHWGTATTTTKVKKGTKDEPADFQGKEGSLSGIALELRRYVETEGLVCPNQAEHLRGEQMWKNCRLC
ncbi:hypothetical protein DM02DRAFT_674679 [Periconia macrospinosa]|uniref:Uncharacterized protein n=1 Tax=Periconia macrospinosa TaxID=97972 RepID=A0A2V1DF37_9PLEO|nr:hypothetical protein DM02DRAFT_674679 [Periconia macrospinosa]